jgi:hypothetical protein
LAHVLAMPPKWSSSNLWKSKSENGEWATGISHFVLDLSAL